MRKHVATLAILLLSRTSATADEGMWTFNNFPKDEVKQKYGFEPTDAWLEHAQLASVRIANGCSASLVSEGSLVMTNHHCAHHCIAHLSTADKDYVKNGYYASTLEEEQTCPGMEINQLIEITDITERMNKATRGLSGEKFTEARKAETARIEKECATSDKLRCDVVSLYHGGIYNLYKYRRFQDVRLVFAPELSIAFFGGDPDNFMFPRWDLDLAFLRIYENGTPLRTGDWFKWSARSAREGDLAFVIGNPGGTDRHLTVAELAYARDTELVDFMVHLAQFRGFLNEYAKRGPEQQRQATEEIFFTENELKRQRGYYRALASDSFFAAKVAEENELRAKVAANAEWNEKYGGAWDAMAKAMQEYEVIAKELEYLEWGGGFESSYYRWARTLVRGADELPKKNEKRLKEWRDSNLPVMKQRLLSPRPTYPELETAMLAFSLTMLREELGPDHAFTKKVLGKESPDEVAKRLVEGTKLADPEERRKLWEGGKKAIQASKDPMIQLARLIDGDGRAIRKKYEDTIDSVKTRSNELIARARFEVYGMKAYPDATFTPRVSYGTVKGWEEKGTKVKPLTTMGGAFERATGRPPFDLPKSWLDAKSKITASTPMNLCTTNDIIGGNSGSPLINQEGEIIGLVFDGNIHSLGGNYGFDESRNRTISVHSDAILHSLEKIYGAKRIVDELRPSKKGK